MSIKLEIEGVFKVATRGQFVVARRLDPLSEIYVTRKSFLGGTELLEYLDIPRSVDENGNQRDVFSFQLKYPEQASKLIPNSIVELIPGDGTHFLAPWYEISNFNYDSGKELFKEISPGHLLYGKMVREVAKNEYSGEVLFELIDDENKYAVVMLTWKSKVEKAADFPSTKIFKTWMDLYNNCIVSDHEQFYSKPKL